MAINAGRITKVGIGIETTYGTKASSITYIPWLDFAENPKQEKAKDESAIGRIEKPLGNSIVRTWAEPTISFIATQDTIGKILKLVLGTVATTGPTDSAYTHAFTVKNDNAPNSATICFKDANRARMITGAVVNTCSFQIVQNDYIKVELSFIGKAAVDTTETPSFTAENQFTGTMPTIKLASTIAGLAGASAVCFQEMNLEINKNASAEEFFCIGSSAVQNVANKSFELSGSFTKKMDSETYQDLFDAGTNQAIQVAIVNTGATIGASTNPSLTLTIAPSSLENYNTSIGIDDIITESFDFVGQYSQSDSKMISASLVNATVSY